MELQPIRGKSRVEVPNNTLLECGEQSWLRRGRDGAQHHYKPALCPAVGRAADRRKLRYQTPHQSEREILQALLCSARQSRSENQASTSGPHVFKGIGANWNIIQGRKMRRFEPLSWCVKRLGLSGCRAPVWSKEERGRGAKAVFENAKGSHGKRK